MGKNKETDDLDLGALPFMRTLSPWNEGNLQAADGKSENSVQAKSENSTQGKSEECAQGNHGDPGAKNQVKETMDEPQEQVRQNSAYGRGNRPRVDNNNFFGERSNPLSSKGD